MKKSNVFARIWREIKFRGVFSFLLFAVLSFVGAYLFVLVLLLIAEFFGSSIADLPASVHKGMMYFLTVCFLVWIYRKLADEGKCPHCEADHAMELLNTVEKASYDGVTTVTDEVRRPGKIRPDQYITRTVAATVTEWETTYKCRCCGFEMKKEETTKRVK